jgi:hypothetical protein
MYGPNNEALIFCYLACTASASSNWESGRLGGLSLYGPNNQGLVFHYLARTLYTLLGIAGRKKNGIIPYHERLVFTESNY